MNPNPDETSPASGRQHSKSLEEISKGLAKTFYEELGPHDSCEEKLARVILRALQAATAESEDKLKRI